MTFRHHQHFHNQSRGSQGAIQGGLFQAAQQLGSVGAPTGNLRTATLGTTSAGTDALLPSNSAHLQHPHASANTPHTAQSTYNSYDDPRRPNTIGKMSDHQSYQSSPHLQQDGQYSSQLPGSLQPAQGRPGPASIYTAPSAVPQMNTNASQYSLPTRSNTMHSHSHSRSEAGLDQQRYVLVSTPAWAKQPCSAAMLRHYSEA